MLGRDKTMAEIPVIDEYTWARIVAKAYLDTSDFKSKLETDPAAAVNRARLENPEFNIPAAPVRLLNLSYSTGYSGPPDTVAMLLTAIFQGSTQAQLQEIFNSGTFDGKPVEMPCGEWINPTGPIKLFYHNGRRHFGKRLDAHIRLYLASDDICTSPAFSRHDRGPI